MAYFPPIVSFMSGFALLSTCSEAGWLQPWWIGCIVVSDSSMVKVNITRENLCFYPSLQYLWCIFCSGTWYAVLQLSHCLIVFYSVSWVMSKQVYHSSREKREEYNYTQRHLEKTKIKWLRFSNRGREKDKDMFWEMLGKQREEARENERARKQSLGSGCSVSQEGSVQPSQYPD